MKQRKSEFNLVFKNPDQENRDMADLIAKPVGGGNTSAETKKIDGIVIGTIREVHTETFPSVLVDYPGKPVDRLLPAISTRPINAADAGREVALMFQEGDLHQPIILGFIESLQAEPPEQKTSPIELDENQVSVDIDGEHMSFNAKEQLVFKCGKASITLTKSGKILLRGTYLLNRSSGVNRIKGGSVQIN